MKCYVRAMETINPQMCDQFGVYVEVEQGGEGPVPHVHVYWDKSRSPRKCSYVRLDKAEYSDHHKQPSKPLPRQVKKVFLDVMTKEWGRPSVLENGTSVTLTGYQRAVDVWVDTYESGSYDKFKLDEQGLPVMPNYNRL